MHFIIIVKKALPPIWSNVFLLVIIVTSGVIGIIYSASFIHYSIIVATVGSCTVLLLRSKIAGAIPFIFVMIGASTVIFSSLISTQVEPSLDNVEPHLFWWEPAEQKELFITKFASFGKSLSLTTGTLCILFGLIVSHKPGLLYVKNRLPFEYPYPIWKSKEQSDIPTYYLVPLKKLLLPEERIILSRYRYVLVMIDNKPFLVSKDERVPEGTLIVRTRNGKSICGL